eukprot:4200256-Pleurochrysis_carterae.AAC.1
MTHACPASETRACYKALISLLQAGLVELVAGYKPCNKACNFTVIRLGRQQGTRPAAVGARRAGGKVPDSSDSAQQAAGERQQ